MRSKTWSWLLACMLVAVASQAQDLDEILAKNYQARGGLEKIKAVKSAKATGAMTAGPGMEAPFTWEWKRPGMFRLSFTLQGQTGTQAYDGEHAWMYMPFMGKTEPELLSEDQAEDMKQQADFDGPLVDWQDKGYQVKLLGKEDAEGTEAWAVEVTLDNGDVLTTYLDADLYLEIMQKGKVKRGDAEIEAETTFGNYKEVEGLVMPFSITSRQVGAPSGQGMSQTITIDQVELDVDIPDSDFAFPGKAKEEKKEEKKDDKEAPGDSAGE